MDFIVGNAAIAKAAEAAWLKSLYNGNDREQSKHAIAVAAATAAAADAAVAAAQAAVEVVSLTSQGPASSVFAGGGAVADPRGRAAAAVKIQTAKKALRALKALVKLQALVRGYLVRKQAAATLQSMQALVRAQATIRAARSRAGAAAGAALPPLNLHHPPVRPRYSLQERYTDETRSEHGAAAYSRRLSASIESSSYGYDRSPKSRSSSLRTSPPVVDGVAGFGEECYAHSVSSPLLPPSCHHHLLLPPGAQPPPRIAVRQFPDYDWCALEKARPATAQSTPRCAANYTPVTPSKSVCGYSPSLNCPNYMSSTQSSEAKVRSQSAPKQRPEPGVPAAAAGGGGLKRVPLSEVILEAQASLSGVGMQRSCHRAALPIAEGERAVGERERGEGEENRGQCWWSYKK